MKRTAYLITGAFLGSVITAIALTVPFGVAHSQDRDPVKVSPDYYKVLLDNEQVRVLEYRLKPGQKEAMHSHSAGIVYGFTAAKTKSISADGKVTEGTGKAGDVFWRNPTTHMLENIGKTDVQAPAVELKSPCK
jgi:beta-alanine degradation protein BauB